MPSYSFFPPRRPRPVGRSERLVSLLLVAAAAGACAWFFAAGAGVTPAAAPGAPPAAAGTPAAAGEGGLPLRSPGGWPRGAIESYDEVSLFEKIDGKADAYLLYRFTALRCATYTAPSDPSAFVDVFDYDMGDALCAYGIYRFQRGDVAEGLDVPDEACASGAAAFLRRGRHYVEFVGSGPEAAGEARALARSLSAALPAGAPPAADPPWFPTEGRTRLGYELTGALGSESLVNAFVAAYDDGTQAVVAELPDSAAAEAAAKDVRETLEFLGTKASFAARGARVVGVTAFPDDARGQALLTEILRRLPEAK